MQIIEEDEIEGDRAGSLREELVGGAGMDGSARGKPSNEPTTEGRSDRRAGGEASGSCRATVACQASKRSPRDVPARSDVRALAAFCNTPCVILSYPLMETSYRQSTPLSRSTSQPTIKCRRTSALGRMEITPAHDKRAKTQRRGLRLAPENRAPGTTVAKM